MKYIILILQIVAIVGCKHTMLTQDDDFFTIADSLIHYKISGEGSPVLLLHGAGLNLDAWDTQIQQLNNNNYKTIRYSELAHGKTKRGNFDLKGTEIIDRFIAEKCKCSGQKINIIGLSWGGVLAADYALKHPDKVGKIILVSPGINGWDWFSYPKTRNKYEVLKKAYEDNDSMKVGELSYNYWIIGPNRKESELDEQLRVRMRGMILFNMENHWGESRSSLDSNKSIDRLNEIKIPSLIISGDQDAEDILEIAKIYKSGIKNSKHIILKNVGHSLNVEKPKEFNNIILSFLNE